MIKLHHHHHHYQQQQQLQQQQQQQQHDAIMTADEAQLTSESGSSKQTLEVNKYGVFVVVVHTPFVSYEYRTSISLCNFRLICNNYFANFASKLNIISEKII